MIRLRKVDEENKKMKEENQQMKEENKQMKEENQQMKEENQQMKEVVEELRDMIECPVCLLVPRQGKPVPVCNNGHLLCHTCRDRIKHQAGADGVAKCPSCTVDLGDATSLLAARLAERVKHECEHEGCEEKVTFAELENHQLSCLFRKVLCPGSGKTCKLELPLIKIEEHVKSCPDHLKPIKVNDAVFKLRMAQRYKDGGEALLWGSHTVSAHGKLFFLRIKREKQTQVFETVMLGSAEECKGYVVTTKILEKDSKTFTANTSSPRPISEEMWSHPGLMLPEKALKNIWRPDGDQFLAFDVQICIRLAQDS